MEESMTAAEAVRMLDWLRDHGHTAEEAIECLKHVATGTHNNDEKQD